MDPEKIFSKLLEVRLSKGARAESTIQRPGSILSNLEASLKGATDVHARFGAVPQQETKVKVGNDRSGNNNTSPPVTLVVGATHTCPSTNETKFSKTNQDTGGQFGAKPMRTMRSNPRFSQHKQQQLPVVHHENKVSVVEPSSDNRVERFLQTVTKSTVAAAQDAISAPPPVAVALTNVEPNAVRMATLVAGTAANPTMLEPIDNFNAQKPIIRTAPPCDHRYIIVGDVHGCPEALENLMLKVNYRKGKDCLILAGDLVNKGPNSIGAVRLAQSLGAIGVLGNHDSTLLICIARSRKPKLTEQEELDPVMQLALCFPKECQDYLRSLPHILRIPKYNVVVVHAGFNLNNPIENQDVFEIMHMRRLEKLSGDDDKEACTNTKARWRAVVKGTRGRPWAELWEGPECVVFGHDARSGLQTHPFAYGLDTGCVYGHTLTCVVYGPESPKGALFSVPGLPKFTNEKRGLPSPAAPVYEQCMEELEKQILRPTSRPASSKRFSGYKPTFLSAPPNYSLRTASTAVTAASGACSEATPSPKICAVEAATLLSLSQAGELSAVNTLMRLPVYEAAWRLMLRNGMEDCTHTFWIPFVGGILEKLLNKSTETSMDCIDGVLQLALEACDELEAVQKVLAPQLRSLLAREDSGVLFVSKNTMKLLRFLAIGQW
ncbi:putative serine/threonine protein phosphatase [Trypanosoma rangeli]|uniref:Putative serine/threonine protein phosphatase n=1 Tax=Trypanosoma rangeli TaxID=5698 RepID=A0A3R7K273_TRYRA|nr:putative serine/threonine protein phosphatase [Trypanosoma rangeli]RNF00496.1 putative serine/threonine protein phosphatase [Trypanosoma rangeli]|eukprot:RNF00496.1 putative serine/threonine protein phosphatase [Trypanosoma rangeli]